MKNNFVRGMLVTYRGHNREHIKKGKNYLINDVDEYGLRLVGILGYYEADLFEPAIAALNLMDSSEKSKLFIAATNGEVLQVLIDDEWSDLGTGDLLVFHKKKVYRIKPKDEDTLDKLLLRKKVTQERLLDVERKIEILKKEG